MDKPEEIINMLKKLKIINNYKIFLILKLNSIELNDITYLKFDGVDIDLYKLTRNRDMIYTTLTEKQYCLLENFKEVFISDHKSDLESVELASEKFVYLLTEKSNLI